MLAVAHSTAAVAGRIFIPPAPSSSSTPCHRALLWREALAVTRNPADVAGRMLIFCWISLFVGLIFYSLDASLTGVRNRCVLPGHCTPAYCRTLAPSHTLHSTCLCRGIALSTARP